MKDQRMKNCAERLAEQLEQQYMKVVFAESCTAGLVAATMAQVPGISRWLCGSVVTYREAMKTAWLNVGPNTLKNHTAVSAEVTEEMIAGVMQRTREANCGAAVTGHLGPGSPDSLDGIVFVSVARSSADGSVHTNTQRHQLKAISRRERQREAADQVIIDLTEWLAQS